MSHVYGDSTPFPYDINYIEVLRHAVDCAVNLMSAQQAIAGAVDRSGNFEQLRKAERSRLAAMSDAIKLTMTAFASSNSERMVRTAARVLDTARSVIEDEMNALEGQASGELSHTRSTVERAREAAYRAIEAFILRNDLPHSQTVLKLQAGEETYAGQVVVATPFGIDAVFSLAIPSAHEWGRPRRVVELSAGTEVSVPQESGWLSKKVEMAPVKLDKLFVSEVTLAQTHGLITLRRGPRSGAGYELEILVEERPKLILSTIDENGSRTSDPPLTLAGQDQEHGRRLWNRVVNSTQDLIMRRQTMVSANFDDRPLGEADAPQAIAVRLIGELSTTVNEIALRSGAPGELVIRRDLGEGRREEIYITKSELHEKVMTLPHELRGVFDPLDLSEGPRSPRAPLPSEPINIGLDSAQFADELTRKT